MLGYAQPGGIADTRRGRRRSCCFLLGADEVDLAPFAGSFKVYIGHHGDKGAHAADVDPARRRLYREARHPTSTSRAGCSIARRRSIRRATRARTGRSCARLSDALGKPLPFDSFGRAARRAVRRPSRASRRPGLVAFDWAPPKLDGRRSPKGTALAYPIQDFYLTNPIARSSPTLQRCSAEMLHGADLCGGGGMTAWSPAKRPPACGCHWAWCGWFTRGTLDPVILLIALPLMLAVAMIIYADRKIWAAMALRRGPNVVGPFGLLQSFADGLKVFLKETIIPSAANRGLFLIAPIITFTVALIAWAVIPFGDGHGARRHQCRPALPARRLVARRLRRSSSPAGRPTRNIRSTARCAPLLRWCPTKSRSASC